MKRTGPRRIGEKTLTFLSQVLIAVLERRRKGFLQSTADEIQQTVTDIFVKDTKKSKLAYKVKRSLKIAEHFGILREKEYSKSYKMYFLDSAVEDFLMCSDVFHFLDELQPNNPGLVFTARSRLRNFKNWIFSKTVRNVKRFTVKRKCPGCNVPCTDKDNIYKN